jgi:4-aminobutyrate aminotransferase-like enzyme
MAFLNTLKNVKKISWCSIAIIAALALTGCQGKEVIKQQSTIVAKCGNYGWIVEIDGKRYLDFGNSNMHPLGGTMEEMCK